MKFSRSDAKKSISIDSQKYVAILFRERIKKRKDLF